MFCKKCGKENDNDANFCIYCGAKLSTEDTEEILKKEDTENKKKKSGTEKVSNFFRWYFGLSLMVGSVLMLSVPSSDRPPAIFLIFAFLLGCLILPVYKNKLPNEERVKIGGILFVIAATVAQAVPYFQTGTVAQPASLFLTDKTGEERQVSATLSKEKLPPLPKKIDIKTNAADNKSSTLYDPEVLNIIPLERGKGYDKTFFEYGVKGVKKINKLLPEAAELMSKNAACDKVIYVAHSDKGSPSNIVIFGHCNNGARLYLSEKEIDEQKVPLSRRQKLEQMEVSLMTVCDEIVKSRLTYPSTFDKSILRSGVSTDENKTTVLVGFSAKNAFNLELKYKAVCIFNDTPELVNFSMEEDN